jgi:RimJ/RimL family protein N-acetyltransferase
MNDYKHILVTPHNKAVLEQLKFEIEQDPVIRFALNGSWTNFDLDITSTWNREYHLLMKSGHVIGYCKLYFDRGSGLNDISWTLAIKEEYRNDIHGIAVGQMMADYTFEKLGADILRATVFSNNVISLKIHESFFTSTGYVFREFKVGNNFIDKHFFHCTRERWEEGKRKRS